MVKVYLIQLSEGPVSKSVENITECENDYSEAASSTINNETGIESDTINSGECRCQDLLTGRHGGSQIGDRDR